MRLAQKKTSQTLNSYKVNLVIRYSTLLLCQTDLKITLPTSIPSLHKVNPSFWRYWLLFDITELCRLLSQFTITYESYAPSEIHIFARIIHCMVRRTVQLGMPKSSHLFVEYYKCICRTVQVFSSSLSLVTRVKYLHHKSNILW